MRLKCFFTALAVAATAALSGCASARGARTPAPGWADPIGLEATADPDDWPPVVLSIPVPPPRRVPPPVLALRVPARPDAIGKLEAPLKRRWQYIVIHHSFTRAGNEAIFDRYAKKERGWQGVGYHFVIGNGHGSSDGTVEVTFRWEKQIHGAHAGVKEYNERGIGICLVGDFQNGYPTEKQMVALAALVNYLQARCDIPTSRILLHRHIRNTQCPGKNFPFFDFISLLDH